MNITKENFIPNQEKEIQNLLKKISKKSKAFSDKNKGQWFGDLGSVLEDLNNIDKFLK